MLKGGTARRLIGWLLAAALIGCGQVSAPLEAVASTTLVAPATAIPAGDSSVSQTPHQPTSTLSAPPASAVVQNRPDTQPPAVTPLAVAPTSPPPQPSRTAQGTPALATRPAHEPPRTPIAPARLAPPQAESFLIYGLGAAASGAGSPDQYRQDVRAATVGHLAARLGVPAGEIAVVGGDAREVASAAPCGGSAKVGAAGLRMGYEVVLEARAARHRYVAVGGMAYYCGEL